MPKTPSPKKKAIQSALERLDGPARELLARQVRRDGWMNAATGFGVVGRDARVSSEFVLRVRALEEWEELHRGCDIAANICDAGPEAMTREGWEPSIEDDKDQMMTRAVISRSEDIELLDHVETALMLANVYGGGALLLGADDGQDISKPLKMDRIRSFDWMTPLSPRELWVTDYYNDPGEPKFAQPEFYRLVNIDGDGKDRLAGKGGIIHETRLVRFDGVKVPHRVRRRQRGWGDSVLLRCDQVLADFNMSWAGAAKLLGECSIATLGVEGLAEMIGEDDDSAVSGRAQAIALSKSVAGLLLLDSKETFKRETASLAGVPEMLQQFFVRLATAARMPVTIMSGQAPAGLNATGDSDVRSWYDQVKSKQKRRLLHQLLYIYKVMFNAATGPTDGEEPENYTVTFKPLWQLTDAETADLRNKQSLTDVAYINAGVVPATVVAKARFSGPTYSFETHLTEEDVQKMEEADKLEVDTSSLAKQVQQKQLEARSKGKADPTMPPAPGSGVPGVPAGFAPKQLPPGSATSSVKGDAMDDQLIPFGNDPVPDAPNPDADRENADWLHEGKADGDPSVQDMFDALISGEATLASLGLTLEDLGLTQEEADALGIS